MFVDTSLSAPIPCSPPAMTTGGGDATQVLMAVAASNGTNSTADEVLHGVDEIVNETLEPAVEREALAEGVGSTFGKKIP